jgi:hypothetical protein
MTFRTRVQKAIEHLDQAYGDKVVYERMSDVARRLGARL